MALKHRHLLACAALFLCPTASALHIAEAQSPQRRHALKHADACCIQAAQRLREVQLLASGTAANWLWLRSSRTILCKYDSCGRTFK